MIEEKELKKLKEILLNSKNPIFLFDNDPDGVCSTAILLKNLGKGRAFVLKSIDKINGKLSKKIFSYYPSEIFILDKPIYDEEFFQKAKEKKIKIIFIDHHEQKKDVFCIYFNSFPSSEPVSYITQKIFDSKETRLLSLIGCISDIFLPDFFEEEKQKYKEILSKSKDCFDIIYSTEFGKAVRILSLSLRNSDSLISKILFFLTKINSPFDILVQDEKNLFMHQRFRELLSFIDKNVEKAKIFNDLVFLEFSGKYSLSSEIANEILFLHRKKFIVVCYKKDDFVNISLRGENSKKIVEKVLNETENSIGGGHEKACGLRIPSSEFEKFKKLISDFFSVSI